MPKSTKLATTCACACAWLLPRIIPNAIFVSRGLGNSYQTLTDNVIYGYLVNQHWSPDAQYTLISFRDPQLGIPWPIEIDESLISEKDLNHPPLGG